MTNYFDFDTKHCFLTIREICNQTGGKLQTNFYGDNELYKVTLIYQRGQRQINISQVGDSLHYCLAKILNRNEIIRSKEVLQ